MSKKGQHTPISDDEAEEWVRRMISSAEDLGKLSDWNEWTEFVTDKLYAGQHQDITSAQVDVFARGRAIVQQSLIEVSILPVTFIRRGVEVTAIRDVVTGRFTSLTIAQQALTAHKIL